MRFANRENANLGIIRSMASTQPFTPADFFVIRTPLLPFAALVQWAAGLRAPASTNASRELVANNDLTVVLKADYQQLRNALRSILERPLIGEAIFVASPDLSIGLTHWLENPESEKGVRAERALVRYLLRMAGRATPFGLFAGCSLGKIGKESQFHLAAGEHYQRHTRLDMDYLFGLCEALGGAPVIQARLSYVPNSSLYQRPGHYRYAEARLNEQRRTYQLVVVEANDYLTATLQRAQQGATPVALAAALVADDAEISREEAESYIGELIANQVLLSPLTPAVTGQEPIHWLMAVLEQASTMPHSKGDAATADPIRPVLETLRATHQALATLDRDGLGLTPARYQAIAAPLQRLPTPVKLEQLFQVDLIKPAPEAVLGGAVLAEIKRGVALLQRIVPTPGDDPLAHFRQQFVARYEGRTVPLLEALDEESGIGFQAELNRDYAPLLTGLRFPPAVVAQKIAWGNRQQLLLHRLDAIWRSGAQVLELSDAEVAALTNPQPLPLPNSFAVMATVAASSSQALKQGDFQLYFHHATGPSGARLLGRFCHGDPQLHQAVAAYLAAEAAQHPDAILAEIVHLPEGRTGNILCRPLLRQYEIPYLGQSGAPADQQIPLTDLMVAVVNDEIVLYSQRLQQRILPRLSNAHNFSLPGPNVYSFLCSLREQGVAANLTWDWGALTSAAFLPRLTYGRLVLARARWRVVREEIQRLVKPQDVDPWRAVQEWRKQRQLPRWVLLSDGDNELPIDLDNILCVENFVDSLRTRPDAVLHELFPGPDQLCAIGPEGAFVHELVVPFTRQIEAKPADDKKIRGQIDGEKRANPFSASPLPTLATVHHFPPGSQWLYLKLYTGAATADQVLCQVIAPLVRQALAAGAVDRWFFVRYSDPDWHLRLRLHGDPAQLLGEVLPACHAAVAPWIEDGRIWKLQIDTYEREVERYGGPIGAELAEQLFHADSEGVLAIIEAFAGNEGADARWRLCLLGMDRLLDDLGFDHHVKQTLLQRVRSTFQHEFHADSKLRGQLGEKYRQERKELQWLLDPNRQVNHALAFGVQLLQQRSLQLQPIIAQLLRAEDQGQLGAPLSEIALSYLHMHANRLLRSLQREQELVLYDLLARHYESMASFLIHNEPTDEH